MSSLVGRRKDGASPHLRFTRSCDSKAVADAHSAHNRVSSQREGDTLCVMHAVTTRPCPAFLTLKAWVREAFSGIRNTAPPAVPDYGPQPAFGEGELGRKVTVVPLKEARRLSLSWPLPPRRQHKLSKPTAYVSHLLVSGSLGRR